MEAYYFGDKEEIFGIYHEPYFEKDKQIGVVICNPLGQEYIRSHKAIRILAQGLSDSGYHVLRFDYIGTGDSYKYDDDISLKNLLSNVELAITELKDSCGIDKIVVVGLRFGAALATIISQYTLIERIVLWNPVYNGENYLKEISVSYNNWLLGAFAKSKKTPGVSFESHGFAINEKLYSDIKSYKVENIISEYECKILIIHREKTLNDILNKTFKGTTEYIDSIDGEFWIKMEDEINKSLVPVQEIDAIVNWLNKY
jgi:uncharacterized protein